MNRSIKYRGVFLQVHCPNRCFEKLIDQGMGLNRINGIDPEMFAYDIGRTSFEIRRWSHKLQRHSHSARGHYISLRWTHCPYCGEKLIEAGEESK